MTEKKRKHPGDRRDGELLRRIDPMHILMGYMLPNRADNEAFIQEAVDMAPIQEYLDRKNAELVPEEGRVFKYTAFQVVLAALAKTIYLRPKMNRFYSGFRMYQRNKITVAFIAKRRFNDDADECLLHFTVDENTTIQTVHSFMKERLFCLRDKGETDHTTNKMQLFTKLPRFVMRIVVGIMNFMEYFDILPASLIKEEPYHATVFLSNLGSIKLNAAYHHLANWGTNSIFGVIGAKHPIPYEKEDGMLAMKEVLDLGLTLDERIADGYYYSKTMRLLRHLLAHPELLEAPVKENVDYDC